MSRWEARLALGVLLVAGGVLFLLQNLHLLVGAGTLFWVAAFAAAGGIFLYVFAKEPANWWAVIPGISLLGIAALIGLSWAAPAAAGVWGGGLFLGAIGVGFWVVYLMDRERWWAIIPGGVLVTLALVTGVSAVSGGGADAGALFFIGLGLTFGAVYLLPSPKRSMRWALIPALVLLLLGVLVGAAATTAVRFIWPVVLMAIGAVLLFRTVVRHGP
jgi:hypothetical protein